MVSFSFCHVVAANFRFDVRLAVARCREALSAERAAEGFDVHVSTQVTPEIALQPLRFAAQVTLVEEVVPLASADFAEMGSVVLAQVEGRLELALGIDYLPRYFEHALHLNFELA